ncbi:MAG: Ig-like domain-containing protein [Oscillospiraceae bacterium]|nr:Ig-like domain-containing protein [Oscillospiraceae bacterium]
MKNYFKSFLSCLLALMMIVSVAAVPSSAASVKLNYSSFSLTKGYSTTLKVSGTSGKVTWSTGNKEIATVSSSGKVIGKGLGTTYIYAKVGSTTLKSKVNVVAGKITVGSSSVEMDQGDVKKIKIKAVGTHNIAVASTNSKVVKGTWNGAKFDGNYIYLTLQARSNGTAKIKVYAKKYPSTIYKYISVQVGDVIEDDDIQGVVNTSDTLLASTNAVSVEANATQTFEVYSNKLNKVVAETSDKSVAAVATQVNKNSVTVAVRGISAGTAKVYVYLSDNTSKKGVITVTVTNNSTYYQITDTAPVKKVSTDKVLQFNAGNAVKYMLLPEGYDMAEVNQLIAENIKTYQYYTVYTKTPSKKLTTDSVVTVTARVKNLFVTRYVLVPENYDMVQVNDLMADYSGSFEYYQVYTKNPSKIMPTDSIVTWSVTRYDSETKQYKAVTRYMLLPFSHDTERVESIINQDKLAYGNAEEYRVLDSFPTNYNATAYEVFSWINSREGKVKYMLLPTDNVNFVKRNDLVYQDTGVYCYYNAYSTRPAVDDTATEEIIKTIIQVPGESKAVTVYILVNPSDSEAVRQAGINDALRGVYCTLIQK